jgi:hypothetical protein
MSRPVGNVAETSGKPTEVERRAWVRYPRKLVTMWQLLGTGGEEHWTAMVRDLSQNGVGLVINRSFPPATVLTVRLRNSTRTYERSALVRVQHCTAQPAGDWLVGCTFVVKISADELHQLLS